MNTMKKILLGGSLMGLVLCLAIAPPAAAWTFIPIDYPGAGATYAYGVNSSGAVVGWYFSGDYSTSAGFIYQGGSFTNTLNYPGATYTFAYGINNQGVIVGAYWDSSGNPQPFKYDGGTYYSISMPSGATSGTAHGISGTGTSQQIVGQYFDSSGAGHGYLNSTPLDVINGTTNTIAWGVNGAGTVVGSYSSSGVDHGFTYNGGTYTYPYDGPSGVLYTWLQGINNAGHVAGSYGDYFGSIGDHGFFYNGSTTDQIDYPGAIYTNVFGLSNNDWLAGYYMDSSYGTHGFVATPLPSTLLLMGSGLLGLALLRRRFKKN